MGSNLVESLIGAVVLVVAAGFLYIAYTTTDVGGVGGYPLNARFDRTGGLSLGADVRLSGIKIGTVTEQELDQATYQAVVRFTVKDGVQLPTDTFASISSDGLLGDTYLEIIPGGLDQYLKPGDQIEFTEDPVDLFGLISKAVYSVSGDGGSGSGSGDGGAANGGGGGRP